MIEWHWVLTIAFGVFLGMVALELVRLGISMYLMAHQDKRMREFYSTLPPELQNRLAGDPSMSSDFGKWAPNMPISGGSSYKVNEHGYL